MTVYDMVELELTAEHTYRNPFTDVSVRATFTSPTGKEATIAGFHDGGKTWRVRFRPQEAGEWGYRVASEPADPGLSAEGMVRAVPVERPRLLRCTPGENWGFTYSDGEPYFALGETFYNLFGAAFCGVDVDTLLRRRAEQGFNFFRCRLSVSPQHPGTPPNQWETRSTWPWGGTREQPQLDRLNVEWFQSVDRVMRLAEELDVGFEMIMEAWAGEFPWNDRAAMTDELERLWLGYLIARYDAFNSVYLWTIMNEYEYYPDGKRDPKKRPETWAAATTRWMKSLAPHGHPFAVHTGPPMPPFAERFAFDLDAIDVIVYQLWGTTGESDAWLAAGIEEGIQASLAGWPGSAVFMEYGYERDPEVDCLPGSHRHLFVDHTRRGAWRGAMCGLGVGNGFDWTWGPVMIVDRDMPGVAQLALVKRFFTDVVRFETLRPAPELATACGDAAPGEKPLFMADEGYHQIVVYLPVGGTVSLDVVQDREYEASWFDPRTGDVMPATPSDGKFDAPATGAPHPDDWVLVVKCSGR